MNSLSLSTISFRSHPSLYSNNGVKKRRVQLKNVLTHPKSRANAALTLGTISAVFGLPDMVSGSIFGKVSCVSACLLVILQLYCKLSSPKNSLSKDTKD